MDRPSLVIPQPKGAPKQQHRIPGWVGLGLAVLLLLLITYVGNSNPSIESLAGTWTHHRVGADGVTVPEPVELPQVWTVPLASRPKYMFVTRTVNGSDVPQALWIERPRFSVVVTWDGLPVHRMGRVDDVHASGPVLVALPPATPGSLHELGLEVWGGFGESGIGGSILLGPTAAVHEVAAMAQVRLLAIVFGLAMLAMLPLAVASRGPWRPAYSLYGLTAVMLAIDLWAQSPQPASLGVPLAWQLALTRACRWLICPLEVAFFSAYIRGTPSIRTTQLLAVGALGALLTALAPSSMAAGARLLGDVFTLIAIAWGAVLLREAMQRNIEGRWLIATAICACVFAFFAEATLYNGLRSGMSHNTMIAVVMMVSQGAALLIRDANTAERHERLLERFPDPLITVNAMGRITDTNPAARMLFNTEFDTPSSVDLVLHRVDPEHHPRVRGHLRRGLVRTDHIEFRSLDGRWFESAATPVADDRVLIDLRDITARRDMDRGLLQAAKAETTGLLLGGLAHDFNNMLGTLLAHVGILKLRENPKDVAERLRRMESSIDRAASLTKRLLTVSRGTSNTLIACDFGAVCKGAVELVEPTLPSGVLLNVIIDDDLPPVHGDAEDLEQVLVNLLVNARDAVGQSGVVSLVARRFQLSDGSRGVAAMVEDDGPGVAASLREELFQPFVTTKAHGTGLGLAIARQILADHLGRLWHEPAPTGGARFLIALRHADAVHEAPAPLPEFRQILLVDDEEVLLEAWQTALAAAGYTVTSTPDPVEAIALIRESPPDLVITDLAMSPMSGLEVARAAHVYAPTAPVLIVSAFIAPDVESQLGANGWDALTKPIRAARLVAAVGHLRRQAERKAAGVDDITSVMHLFPTLDMLSAESMGFEPRATP